VNSPPRKPLTTRREFLSGRSATRAAEDAWDRWQTAAPATESGAVPSTYLLQVARTAMACEFEVLLNAGESDQATETAIETLDLVELLEAQLTVYRPTSEVSRLNRRAASEPVAVEPGLYELLVQARDFWEWTGGAFDITSGPLSQVWGFARRQGQVPAAEALEAARSRVGMQWLQLDAAQRTVHFLREGMELNLGGIGKGYALDRCAARLESAEIANFLVHGGKSSILARGSRQGLDGWTIGLRHPLRPEWRLGEIRLRDRALGTSGAANLYLHFQGRRLGHVLDPRTGWPAEGLLSATVLAPTATEADALATACYVMSPEEVETFCRQHPDVSVILVAPGQRVGGLELILINLHDESEWQPAAPA
jgi:FAD:protein FMN transferase